MPRYIEEMVSQQIRRSELARRKDVESGGVCEHPIITVSRAMGSGARIVAAKLARDLEWSLWDRELVDAMAQDADVAKRVVEAFDEKTVSDIEALTRSVLGDYEMGGFLYRRHLVRALAVIAKLGNTVILGRGANFVLPQALKVRIDASEDVRVRNMMAYENMTQGDAEVKIRHSDRERKDFLYAVFGHEKVEHARYDITVWMDEFTTDDAVEIVKTALRLKCKPKPG